MDGELDDLSGVPRYQQVARVLESEIRAGTWAIGKPVPSENQLSQRFGIAKATAAKAHRVLTDGGYLARVPGVGMVVTPAARWREADS